MNEPSSPETAEDSSSTPDPDLLATANDLAHPEEDPDLDQRVLCPDGACVGVIGPDGKCKICGAASDDEELSRASSANTFDDGAEEMIEDGVLADLDEPLQDNAEPLDFTSRKLCSDGECIGIIGKDGRCKACGKPYTGEA